MRLRKLLDLFSLWFFMLDSHGNILEETTRSICSLVRTFADFLRIHLGVLPYQAENGGE